MYKLAYQLVVDELICTSNFVINEKFNPLSKQNIYTVEFRRKKS